jgi:hypothetical protein
MKALLIALALMFATPAMADWWESETPCEKAVRKKLAADCRPLCILSHRH